MANYVDETIAKYEKYINPAQAKLFRFMGLGSVEASWQRRRISTP